MARRWNSNYQDLFGQTVKTFKPDQNACVACHRIGSEACKRDDLGGGRVSVREVADKRWMRPGFPVSGTALQWQSEYGAAVEELYKCCDNPSLPSCKTVDQKEEPPDGLFGVPWVHIGHANDVVAMAAINGKLFAATKDNLLWWRSPVGQNVNWVHIGHANDVVAMAAINGKLFAATKDNRLWWRNPVGQNVNWVHIGHANDVVAMTAINGKLFAATKDNRLWWRDPVR